MDPREAHRQMCLAQDEVARLRSLPPSRALGGAAIALLLLLMVGGTVLTCLPIIPSTACLAIAGGSGC